MMSNKLIARAAKDSIYKIGMAYRLNLLYISYSTGDNSEDNHIDVKVYDSVIQQVCNVRLENITVDEESQEKAKPDASIDSLPASILEDYPEATLNLDHSVTDNLRKMLTSTQMSLNGDENTIRKIYDIEMDNGSDDDTFLSDINELNYDSLCIIMTDIFKSMMAITMFSVN